MTGDDLRHLRERTGLSQVDVCAYLNGEIKPNTWSRMELGKLPITRPTLLRLALERLERILHGQEMTS